MYAGCSADPKLCEFCFRSIPIKLDILRVLSDFGQSIAYLVHIVCTSECGMFKSSCLWASTRYFGDIFGGMYDTYVPVCRRIIVLGSDFNLLNAESLGLVWVDSRQRLQSHRGRCGAGPKLCQRCLFSFNGHVTRCTHRK